MNTYHEGMLSSLDLAGLFYSSNTPEEKNRAVHEYLSTLTEEEIRMVIMALISAVAAYMDLVGRQGDKTVHETIEWFRTQIMEGHYNGGIQGV